MNAGKRERSRAADAFRRWARAGCPGTDPARPAGAADEADEAGPADPDFRACAAVFAALAEEAAAGRRNTAAKEIRNAVREVYMAEPGRRMRRSEVTMRVRRLSLERYVSERQVYAWLARAMALWLIFRRTDSGKAPAGRALPGDARGTCLRRRALPGGTRRPPPSARSEAGSRMKRASAGSFPPVGGTVHAGGETGQIPE